MAELKAKIGLDTSAFETGLARLQNTAGSWAKGIGGIFAGAFAFNRVIAGFTEIIDKAGQLQDISDKFGVSAESVQRIGNAAEQSGASVETVAKALARLAVSAQEASGGNQQLAQAFAAIGVSGQQLVSLNPEQLFYRLANAMNDGSLAGKDLAVAKDLLGKSFQDLLPVLRMTEQDIRAIGEASGVMSDADVARLDEFGDAWTRLANKVKVAGANILGALLRLGEEVVKNPLSLFGDWQQIEKNIDAVLEKERKLREARQQGMRAGAAGEDPAAARAAQDFQKERDRQDVAEARQELRLIEADIAGRAAAEKMLEQFEQRQRPEERAPAVAQQLAAPGSPLQVLADSLQQVGGGGRFAQVGGIEAVQKDQLAVLKNIEKNTARLGQDGGNEPGVQ